MNSIRRFFPRQYLLPLALLVLTCFAALLSLLYYLTAIQDRMDTERDRSNIASALQSLVEFSIHDLQDYAIWDDAARAVLIKFDPGWVDANVGIYLGQKQGYTHLFIVRDGEETVYSYDLGRPAPAPLDAYDAIGEGLRRGIADAGSADIVGADAVGGYSGNGEHIYVYAAADVVPLSRVNLAPVTGRYTMVIARLVNDETLQALSARYALGNLHLASAGPRAVEDETVQLRARDGAVIGEVLWTPDRPGTKLMHQMLPGLLVIALVSFFAGGMILHRARLSNEALDTSRASIRFLAYHDPLTGLANRRRFLDRMRDNGAGPEKLLLYMDLDGFKEANDVYGHAIGDDVLVEAARRIHLAAPDEALVARTGGDEFAVLLAAAAGEPARTSERILGAFEPPFQIGRYSINIGVSIGAAQGAQGMAGEELMRRADVAMYTAKSRGKRGWLSYEPQFDAANLVRHSLEGDLRRAVADDEIDVAFQPIVNSVTGRMEMVEALARWDHASMGTVPPDQFIRVAEQSGLINDLGRKVLRRACVAARDWDLRLSVNLSPVQFWDRDLFGSISRALSETGFPPQRLDLEITERHLLRRPDEAERILSQFRALGIRIALDDFGTGYTSIGYLKRLSLDRIKIDRSFVVASEHDRKSLRLAAAIVELGVALELPVTAEGVENETQARLMRQIGCTHLQGWLYGHALSGQEIAAILAMRTPVPEHRLQPL